LQISLVIEASLLSSICCCNRLLQPIAATSCSYDSNFVHSLQLLLQCRIL